MKLKKYLKKEIFSLASEIDYIQSTSLVGSFSDKKNLDGISDIDTIIIIDKLDEKKFNEITTKFQKLCDKISENTGYKTKINSTFGPLKYNEENLIVFHLMIYDLEGHILHCVKSPFTCLEWQRTKSSIKLPLIEIWGVNALQPNYFFNSRRSVKDYLKDLESNSISYRKYEFSSKIKEIKESKSMTNKDKFEFAYHIIKFCMLNFVKLHTKKNILRKQKEISNIYFSIFPKKKKQHLLFFNSISKYKNQNKFPTWNLQHEKLLKEFLKNFESQFNERFDKNSTKLFFMRHQKTKLNKNGIFLGRHNNPKIIKPKRKEIKTIKDLIEKHNVRKILSSPLLRTIESAKLFKKDLIIDQLLLEIDYGDADGLSIKQFKEKYPYIIEAWKNNLDPKFPNGENTSDIEKRTELFLKKTTHENSLIISHNVFLRVLLGRLFRIPKTKWHQIKIPHLEPLEIIKTNDGKFFPNLTEYQIKYIFSDINFKK
jgi:probable phosphoglycerate mutase